MANEKFDDTYSKNAMFCLILDLPHPNVWMVKFFAVDKDGIETNLAYNEINKTIERLDESFFGTVYSGDHINGVISVIKEKYGKTFNQLFIHDAKVIDSDSESLKQAYLSWLDSYNRGE
jgi:hypothetical protein